MKNEEIKESIKKHGVGDILKCQRCDVCLEHTKQLEEFLKETQSD